MVASSTLSLRGIFARSADEFIAVGESGTIVHGQGADFRETSAGTGSALRAVLRRISGDLLVVGVECIVRRSATGAEW